MVKEFCVVGICMGICAGLAAKELQTGQLVVTLTDTNHCPITNGIVTVRSPKGVMFGRGSESEYNYDSAATDTNGVAIVSFTLHSGDFRWAAEAPSHYYFKDWKVEHFKSTVVDSDYLHIDTNTVDGLAKYQELKALDKAGDYVSLTNFMAKFEPKSVDYANTRIERSLCLHPKLNPQPMCFQNDFYGYYLPMKGGTVETNGETVVVHYRTVGFDMKAGRFMPPWGERDGFPAGKTLDFRIVRSECMTNGEAIRSGYLEFDPGCGAYKGSMPKCDGRFWGFYEADTNAVYQEKIPFEQRKINGVWTSTVPLLTGSEYLIMRTRVMTNDVGVVTNCNYSTFLGRMAIPWRKLTFDQLIFNPRPNDPNLEYDGHINLADE